MKAKEISGQAPGGKRAKLAKALPLKTPFLIQIFPIYSCNFKCRYCIFQYPEEKRGFISNKGVMEPDFLKKCIDDMTHFPNKIKVLRFVGIGEPLLHPKITDMVKYTAQKKVAKTIEIITNGSLLTPKMSDSLLAAGLTRMTISLQGTSGEKYRSVCQANIDFKEFVDNIRYFYNHKGKAQLYLKIIDCALEDKKDEKKFYQIFGDICDTIAIEHTVPIHSGVDYEKVLKGKDMKLTQYGLSVSEVKICPQPFFHLQINPDGNVVPCYSFEYPKIMENAYDQSVVDIWNGKKFQDFRRLMLNGIKNASKICAHCDLIKYRIFPEDILNDDVKRLKKIFKV